MPIVHRLLLQSSSDQEVEQIRSAFENAMTTISVVPALVLGLVRPTQSMMMDILWWSFDALWLSIINHGWTQMVCLSIPTFLLLFHLLLHLRTDAVSYAWGGPGHPLWRLLPNEPLELGSALEALRAWEAKASSTPCCAGHGIGSLLRRSGRKKWPGLKQEKHRDSYTHI